MDQIWIYTKTDYVEKTPSRMDGVSLEEERHIRSRATSFILNLIASVCVFLACKASESESIRKMLDVAISSTRVYFRDLTRLEESEYDYWRGMIKLMEPLVASTLCFDFNVNHPYDIFLDNIRELDGYDKEIVKRLVEVGWTLINDTYKVPLCLFYTPEAIANASIFIAAKFIGIESKFSDLRQGTISWLLCHEDFKSTSGENDNTSRKGIGRNSDTPDFTINHSYNAPFQSIAQQIEPDESPPDDEANALESSSDYKGSVLIFLFDEEDSVSSVSEDLVLSFYLMMMQIRF
ncbi:4802_t:CDS:2 [Entrophospora sp. SA101]|nr:4802_t:CDS:2 [Entrophospora sp. SA101]